MLCLWNLPAAFDQSPQIVDNLLIPAKEITGAMNSHGMSLDVEGINTELAGI